MGKKGKIIINTEDFKPYDSRYPELSQDTVEKLEKSKAEVEGMEPHELKCPICGFTLAKVYDDRQGHFQLKCNKCKFDGVINMAYFRRVKGPVCRNYPEERKDFRQ